MEEAQLGFWAAFLCLAQGVLNLCRAQLNRLSRHSGTKRTAQCQKAVLVTGHRSSSRTMHTAKSTLTWIQTVLKWPSES